MVDLADNSKDRHKPSLLLGARLTCDPLRQEGQDPTTNLFLVLDPETPLLYTYTYTIRQYSRHDSNLPMVDKKVANRRAGNSNVKNRGVKSFRG